MISSAAVEEAALVLYGSLLSEREDWAGSLTLCCGPVSLIAGPPAVVSICGGTALSVGVTAADAKGAQRHGGVDFVVNTLDEALRTLKNRVRERRALAVALVSELEAVLEEMVERGLAPEYAIEDDTLSAGARGLLGRLGHHGSYLFGAPQERQESRLKSWLRANDWEVVKAPGGEGRDVREWNKQVASVIPQDDEVRQRWMRLAPAYLRGARDGVRCMWLSPAESERLSVSSGSHAS